MSDVIKSVDLADGRVVLFDGATDTYRTENLACFDFNGSLRWRAKLPDQTGSDCFVDLTLDADRVCAMTWSGWMIWFDTASGIVLSSVFTK